MTAVVAPGKAILCGEYAVLHGAPAVSVAVDRSVRAWVNEGVGTERSAFVDAAYDRVVPLLEAEARFTIDRTKIGVDSRALFEGEKKLGLGSSAAVTVAVIGALWAAAGLSLDDRARIFRLADEAHATAQGTRGSGIDVATAVHGGALRFQRRGGKVALDPISLPPGLDLTFVFTGKSASTAQLIAQVRAFAERDVAGHQTLIAQLTHAAEDFAAACGSADGPSLLRAAARYGERLTALGVAASAEIVTTEHARLAEIARAAGGAAKPSGAGGGDLGVAFTFGSDSTQALRKELDRAGLFPLPISAPAPGLRLEKTV